MKMRRKGNVPASEDVVVDEAPESDTPEKVLAGVLAVSAEESAEAGSSSSGVTQNGAGAPAAPAGGAPSSDGGADEARPRKGMLGQLLVKRGLVTDEQVATALSLQSTSGKRLGELLVDIGALDERSLVDALADYFDMQVTYLRRDAPDPAALALVPEQLAREHLAIPVHLDGDGLRVAVAQPSDDLRFLLTETTGLSVRLQLAPLSDIRWAIDRSYQAIGGVDKMVQAFEAVEGTRKREVRVEKPEAVNVNAP
ncbi:MAG TPA: hypothetical protein VNV83_13715, partial [Acidimicrobiales bacterium]|nr:hypothetical protein [Acidimicrobiales bacterium]